MLGDWLVVSQVLPVNPAAAVRGPTHVVTTGATPVLSPAEARRLLAAIDPGTLAGLRDRALVSVMLYSFARVSAVSAMRRPDYFRQERQGWLRPPREGRHAARRPGPPSGGRGARRLPRAGRARRGDGGALPERRPRGAAADGPGALAASRPGHDQAGYGTVSTGAGTSAGTGASTGAAARTTGGRSPAPARTRTGPGRDAVLHLVRRARARAHTDFTDRGGHLHRRHTRPISRPLAQAASGRHPPAVRLTGDQAVGLFILAGSNG